jgi:hypothetical protein
MILPPFTDVAGRESFFAPTFVPAFAGRFIVIVAIVVLALARVQNTQRFHLKNAAAQKIKIEPKM